MKLGLRFLIPLAGLTAFAVNLPAADMISHSGHARTRLELDKNATGTESAWSETWINRVRLNLDIAPTKTLMVRLTPQATHTYGYVPATGVGDNMVFTAAEAWMSWNASDMVTLYAGRQVLSYGKGLIIGANDWGQVPNRFDAVRVRLTYDMGSTDIFYAKIAENEGANAAAADHDLLGFYSALNPDMGVVKNLDLYALWNDNRSAVAVGGSRSRVATLGLRADGDIAMLDYNAELSAQFGKVNGATDIKGFQMDVTAGAKVMEEHHVAANIAYANSEFVDQFADMHAQLGKADFITARNNLISIGLLTKWKLHDQWKAGVDGYYFMVAKDTAGFAGGKAIATESAFGMEGDLTLAYAAEKNLDFEFGYDFFKGGDALKPADEFVSKVYLQGVLSF